MAALEWEDGRAWCGVRWREREDEGMKCAHLSWKAVFEAEDIDHPWFQALRLDRYEFCEYCLMDVFREDTGWRRPVGPQEARVIWSINDLLSGTAEAMPGINPPKLVLPKKAKSRQNKTQRQRIPGRRKIGIHVSRQDRDYARQLGDGIAAEGIRRGLATVLGRGWTERDFKGYSVSCPRSEYAPITATLAEEEARQIEDIGRGSLQRGVRLLLAKLQHETAPG